MHEPDLAALFRGDTGSAVADWESVIEAACEECLLPALASLNLKAPPEVIEFLNRVETANGERIEVIAGEFESAGSLLNEAGIEPVLLKGLAYLARSVFDNAGQRFVMDIDLLIEPEQIGAAVETLARNGWSPDNLDPFRHFRHHAPPMRRTGRPWIELHHSVGTGLAARILPASQVVARASSAVFRHVRVRIPACEDLISHLVIHSQIQHPYRDRVFPPLRAMLDLAHLVRRFGRDIQWDSVFRQFSATGHLSLLLLHLKQAQDSVGLELPFALKLNLPQRALYQRRRLLRRYPALCYVDPAYVLNAALARRLTTLRIMLSTKEGPTVALQEAFHRGNYRNLWADVSRTRLKANQ